MNSGINGFGRIGRLVFPALWGRPGIELAHVNDPAGDAHTAAHLLAFDSVHGRWQRAVQPNTHGFPVGTTPVSWSQESDPTAVPWRANPSAHPCGSSSTTPLRAPPPPSPRGPLRHCRSG